MKFYTLGIDWGKGLRQKRDVIGRGGGGVVASVLDVQSFVFIKGNWICDMTKHHAESRITLFFYKNNFTQTKALILPNKARLAIPQNIRTKSIG